MRKSAVEAMVNHKPFIPLTVFLIDGATLDVPFAHVAQLLADSVIVFKGVKREGSRQATGYDEVLYDRIDRIEPRRSRGSHRQRKAS